MAITFAYDVGFVNPDTGLVDRTQFHATNEDEVRKLFADFCYDWFKSTERTEIEYIEKVNCSECDRLMVMSTAHISKESAELLEIDNYTAIAFPNPSGDGIIVSCCPGMDFYGDGADDIAACIDYAQERGCGYIRFDRDFPAFTDLPVYDW